MCTDLSIKIEGNELQTYLETFNEELETNGQPLSVIQADGENDDDDGGTYFIDESGNYYYQANKDAEPILTEIQAADVENVQYIVEDEEMLVDEPEPTTSTRSAIRQNRTQAKPKATVTSVEQRQRSSRRIAAAGKKNQIIEHEQDIKVSIDKDNEEEISYVFIMEDKEVEGDPEFVPNPADDDGVYDFEDDADGEVAGETEDVKPITSELKKSQSKFVTKVHMCNYCNYTSSKRYLLSRHMKCHSEERPYKCSVCERGFKTWASLQNHANTHTGTKPHLCKYCESTFTTSGELVRHVRYKHTHEKPHKCTECDYASVELSKLKRHIRCHTGERPYECPHCTYASPDTFKLKRHLRIHTGEKPYECDVCQARFTQSNSLKAHKLIHSVGDKPVFHCELCPTTCGRKTDLRIHVQKLHTSEKPLKCKRCGKSFPDRYNYKLHTKTHEGEKCYKCELCPYASISARHLESHMLIHTDQKPFQCESCDQSFRQKQLLKRHVNLFHNPDYVPPTPKEKTHACPNCERRFRHKGNLIRHMAWHDPESAVHKDALALKIGRQKKLQMMDGKTEDIYSDEEDELEYDEEEEEMDIFGTESLDDPLIESGERLLAVAGEDGQQFVVVEVVNADGQTMEQSEHDPDSFMLPTDEEVLLTLQNSKKLLEEPQEDMSNCFGFMEDD